MKRGKVVSMPIPIPRGVDYIHFRNHYMLQKEGKEMRYLCNFMKPDHKRKKRTITSSYSCVQCRRSFYVNCFTLYHHLDTFRVHRSVLATQIETKEAIMKKENKIRDKSITGVSSLKETIFPFERT